MPGDGHPVYGPIYLVPHTDSEHGYIKPVDARQIHSGLSVTERRVENVVIKLT